MGVDIDTWVFYGRLYSKDDVKDHFLGLIKSMDTELEDIVSEEDLDNGIPGKDREPTEDELEDLLDALRENSDEIYSEDEETGVLEEKSEAEISIVYVYDEDDDEVVFLGHVLAKGNLLTNPVEIRPLTPEIKSEVDKIFKENKLGEPRFLLYTQFLGY